ncbi:protein phosphatase 2C domain-containing protein [Leucobacter sp. gxy201]|uniref:PP2C family protein-serine/threonine phosphatase n=1 Tax=Leucobacter sp. gxy201 TaxID=2957200 RepID=UPI003DA113FF
MIDTPATGEHPLVSGLPTPPVIEATARTDVGLRRQVNEDAMLAEHPVYIVADGMGGHDAGDLASRAAVAAFQGLPGIAGNLGVADVDAAIDAARAAVAAVAVGTERGAGCTLTGAVMIEHEGAPHWYVVNIGDSRVYQFSSAGLTQITDDHSLHAELAAAGRAEAAETPRNVITRALGSDDTRHDGWLLPVVTGSRMLMCSDGLTTELDDEEIRAVLAVGGRSEAVADELVRRALEAGGRDNVTAIVVDTISSGSAGTGPIELVGDDEADTLETIEVTRPVRS